MITIDADGPIFVAYGGTWRRPEDCKRAEGKTQGKALMEYLRSNDCSATETVAWDTVYFNGVVARQRCMCAFDALRQWGIEPTPDLFSRSFAPTRSTIVGLNPPRAYCYR